MEPISLVFSAIRVAASIGSFLEKRKTRKLLESKQADALDQHRRDVLLVLGTLGETILGLGIVDAAAVPAATEDVRRCLEMKSPEIREIFDNDLERPLQYAVATGLVFCAACWPMHIHRGFGCSVLNQDHWNDRWDHGNTRSWRFAWEDVSSPSTTQEPVLRTIDDCIAILKPSVQRLHLLSRVPSGLSQIGVNLGNSGNEKYKKKARAWLNDVYAEAKKRGLPQPNHGSFRVTEMIIGFASWQAYTNYTNIFGEENPYYPVKCQGDPGKLLYAYTIGDQLDLQPGQILMPIDRIQYILLTWLEGLDGMTFKLMRDDEFDDKHPKFKKTNRWVFEWNTPSINVVAARDDNRAWERQKRIVEEQATQKSASGVQKEHTRQRKLSDSTSNVENPRRAHLRDQPLVNESTTPANQADDDDTSSLEELFLVLGVLGQRLITLGVIEQNALQSSHTSVSQSISFIAKGLIKKFEKKPMQLQHSITCAIIFCAACYPMHIYRGFGCGVLDNTFWGMHPDDKQYPTVPRSKHLTAMDRVLAYQKSLPDSLRLLKKTPVGVDKELPRFEAICDGEEEQKFVTTVCDDITEALERDGFPRPKDPQIKISSWETHFATWQGTVIYQNNGHSIVSHALWQLDPGRMLYGWTIWNRLDLRPGQAVDIGGEPSSSLALWLEGLEGMTFKILRDEELDHSHIKYSDQVSQLLLETTGNVHGMSGTPSTVVRDPEYMAESLSTLEAPFSNLGLGSDRSSLKSSPSTASTAVEPQKARRRPPPPPPQEPIEVPVAEKVKAKYAFAATDPEELSFVAGAVLEIVDKKRDDGWWMARAGGSTGLIPCDYVDVIL